MNALLFLLMSQLCPAGCIPAATPTLPPQPGGGINAVCPSIKPMAKPLLWKPSADGMTDARKGKPALLDSTHPAVKKLLNVYASNGAKIGTVGYYGVFLKGSRFYSGCCGGSAISGAEFAQRAQSQAGSPNVYVEATTGGCVGPFKPTDRVGGY